LTFFITFVNNFCYKIAEIVAMVVCFASCSSAINFIYSKQLVLTYMLHYPKVQGEFPALAIGTGRENMVEI
jgi:hypothetical protein